MDKKYILKSGERTAWLSRLMAKCIDIFVALILSITVYPFGVLLALTYLSFGDSLQNGQSIGKKLLGLSVVSLEDGSYCSFKQSIIRNLPLTVPLFFMIIPLWGWFFSALIGIPMVLFEIYLLLKIESGNRLGDVMADTTVMANIGQGEVGEHKDSWYDSKAPATS